MRLRAISDLHLGNAANREALDGCPDFGDDWLILAGDVGETPEHLSLAFTALGRCFGRLIWVPGNHELWSVPAGSALRGEAKYRQLVAVCRDHGVTTPEDAFPIFEGDGTPTVVAPLFLLYDYSFRPQQVRREEVVAWAAEAHSVCSDEYLLHPDPYPDREAWCAARCAWSERRLAALDPRRPTVLVNHYPLRYDLVRLPRIPRFSPWCGTRRSEDYHLRFRARAVISGHLHVRGTSWRDGVPCHEVSLGYPYQWQAERGLADYFCDVLPAAAEEAVEGPGDGAAETAAEGVSGAAGRLDRRRAAC